MNLLKFAETGAGQPVPLLIWPKKRPKRKGFTMFFQRCFNIRFFYFVPETGLWIQAAKISKIILIIALDVMIAFLLD